MPASPCCWISMKADLLLPSGSRPSAAPAMLEYGDENSLKFNVVAAGLGTQYRRRNYED